MHMLMPSNVRAVKLYRDAQPLFSRMGVESQLDAMFSPTVQLRSGGYIVINQTEALVSIDVNSGRSTREHHIEDTALKTNLEAAEEVARQLRLRDLAGLIVIDFIDMEEKRNNRAVERKLSECLRQDRARIQIGRISHFGLLEMSRQRIRASVLESSTEPCPHCGGSGHLRSVSSVALQLLRGLEEILMKGATHNLVVRTRTDVALYVLNHKRGHLRDLESSFKVSLFVNADPTVTGQQSYVIDRGEQVHTLEAAKATLAAQLAAAPADDVIEEDDYEFEAEIETDETIGLADEAGATDADSDGEGRSKRKRRRRRRPRSAEAREALSRRTMISRSPRSMPLKAPSPTRLAMKRPRTAMPRAAPTRMARVSVGRGAVAAVADGVGVAMARAMARMRWRSAVTTRPLATIRTSPAMRRRPTTATTITTSRPKLSR